MLQLVESNPPVTDADIAEFERRNCLKLPLSFRDFLVRANGGRPTLGAFPITGLQDNPIGVVHVFFGLGARSEADDLDQVLSELKELVPKGVIPIASTEGDDFVCIDLRKQSAPVVYWDRRNFWGANRWNEEDLYQVVDSFAAFLDTLGPSPY